MVTFCEGLKTYAMAIAGRVSSEGKGTESLKALKDGDERRERSSDCNPHPPENVLSRSRFQSSATGGFQLGGKTRVFVPEPLAEPGEFQLARACTVVPILPPPDVFSPSPFLLYGLLNPCPMSYST